METYQDYSLSGKVFRILRDGILTGKYKEGDELREVTIGKELGVSRTPVREALRQLELEGLVTIVPNKGTYVNGISAEDVRDIYMIRIRLEGLAARLAAKRVSQEQIDEMEEMLLLSEFYRKKGMTEQLAQLDGKFHVILYEACGSRMLKHLLTDFHRYVEMARKRSIRTENRAEKSIGEHMKILEAMKQRDEDQAEKLMEEHIRHVVQHLRLDEIGNE
ncbi:GntR family transcriptional regulator [Drancourtella sp. An210]|nr:GntR family transcriptional regulator [Drancourtella sp. An210]OUP66261.1 GntR family transcriptional regulator [Drancourtella sp. An177]